MRWPTSVSVLDCIFSNDKDTWQTRYECKDLLRRSAGSVAGRFGFSRHRRQLWHSCLASFPSKVPASTAQIPDRATLGPGGCNSRSHAWFRNHACRSRAARSASNRLRYRPTRSNDRGGKADAHQPVSRFANRTLYPDGRPERLLAGGPKTATGLSVAI